MQLSTKVNTFFRFEMNMGKEEPMIKCHEEAEEVNYFWKITSLHSLMLQISCYQGKQLTSKLGSLQTLLSCEFIL